MNETIHTQNKKEILPSEQPQLIHLPAPQLTEIPKYFKALIGTELANSQILSNFAEQYFQVIKKDAVQNFPGVKIGLRAVIGNTTQENLRAENLERPELVKSIKQILEEGTDLKGLITRITRPDLIKNNLPDTDMSAFYLKTMINEALKSKIAEISPLILIYKLDKTKRQSSYEVEFPDQETLKNSLLAIYFIDCGSLINLFNQS
jgi:hypothetical protein